MYRLHKDINGIFQILNNHARGKSDGVGSFEVFKAVSDDVFSMPLLTHTGKGHQMPNLYFPLNM